MVAYVAGNGARNVFDPAVGAGAFFHAAKNIEGDVGPLGFAGTEIDTEVLRQAIAGGLQPRDLDGVISRDFTTYSPSEPLAAIVCNPPYIRHHRLSRETKDHLRALSAKVMGFSIDGRAGFHVYFFNSCVEPVSARRAPIFHYSGGHF